MPKNQKETKSCHDCGFEDFEACETEKQHRPVDEAPCKYCVRNPEVVGWYDFWNENWTLNIRDGRSNPIIEDATPSDVSMLKAFHGIIQKEIDLVPMPGIGRQDRGCTK